MFHHDIAKNFTTFRGVAPKLTYSHLILKSDLPGNRYYLTNIYLFIQTLNI